MRLLGLTRALASAALLTLNLAGPSFAEGNARSSAQPLAAGTSNAALPIQLFDNESVVGINVTGLTAAGATLTVEGSADAKNIADSTKTWTAISAVPLGCPATSFTTLNADQSFKVDIGGLTDLRLRVSSTGAGSILVGYNAIPGSPMTTAACGAGTVTVAPYNYTPLSPGQHNIALTSATALTIPAGATYAIVQAKTATVEYTTDGTTTPTSSIGMALPAGASVALSGPLVLAAFKAISATGTLDVEYYR